MAIDKGYLGTTGPQYLYAYTQTRLQIYKSTYIISCNLLKYLTILGEMMNRSKSQINNLNTK